MDDFRKDIGCIFQAAAWIALLLLCFKVMLWFLCSALEGELLPLEGFL